MKRHSCFLLLYLLLLSSCDTNKDDETPAFISPDQVEILEMVALDDAFETRGIRGFRVRIKNNSNLFLDVVTVTVTLQQEGASTYSARAFYQNLEPNEEGLQEAIFLLLDPIQTFECYMYDVEIISVDLNERAIKSYDGSCEE